MQLNLDITQGERLAEIGLQNAVQKADRDYSDWSTRCWQLFLKWLSKKPVGYHFLVEEFRRDCLTWNKIEEPNSNRAFGFISKRAVNQKLIEGVGTAKTKSAGSHSTPANVWRKL